MREPKSKSATPESDALQRLTRQVGGAYSTALDQAGEAVRETAAGLKANPLAALAGGLAIGIVAGALLPRSERERDALEPVGARINAAARAALDAAKQAGGDALNEVGLGTDTIGTQASRLLGEVAKAAAAAGTAAVSAARDTDAAH